MVEYQRRLCHRAADGQRNGATELTAFSTITGSPGILKQVGAGVRRKRQGRIIGQGNLSFSNDAMIKELAVVEEKDAEIVKRLSQADVLITHG